MSDDTWDIAPPPFNAESALQTMKRFARDQRVLAERSEGWLLGADVVLKLTVDGATVRKPTSHKSEGANTIGAAALKQALSNAGSITVEPGKSVTWTAADPTTPAAGVALCRTTPKGMDQKPINYFGIDKQVIADQINNRLGPLGSVTSGSVSGGSVEMGANVLGSLAGGSGDGDGPPAE